ncbi:hypothetical protein ACROYT_G001651 [Oculina patagonica]
MANLSDFESFCAHRESQVPPVCFGYAVLMYQRNSKLGMLQKLLSILLGSGGCIRRIFTCLNAIGVT